MPRKMPTRSRRPSVRLRSVRLEVLPVGAERPNPDWIQIAAEGEYKGYNGGTQPFTLDAATFEIIVRNFHAHPSYVRAGGPTDVVAFDFSHASEGDPSAIAVEGAPAQAWVQELEIRQGAMGAELWALTRFLEPMLSYRAAGKYKWTSVCVWPDQVDPISGAPIGWVLSSVAFTNDPFIQGMVPFAASRRGFDPFCPPTTPEEVLEALRELFEIPALGPVEDVLANLAKLQSYAANPAAAPLGSDIDEMVGALRQIFNLPTLSSASDVFAQADALLVALAERPPVSTISADRKDDDPMNRFEKACIALSTRLKVKLSNREDEDTAAILCEAVEGAVDGAKSGTKKAEEDLTAMLSALGEQDVPGAMKRIADMISQAAQLKAVMPSLAAYEKAMSEEDDKSVEEDVAMAMTHHCAGATAARAALLHMRKPKPADPAKGPTPEERKAAREAFLATYPPPAVQTSETRTLTARLVSGTPSAAPGPVKASTGRHPVPALPDGKIPTIAEVEAMPGGNPNARAVALVRARGGEKLSHEQACALAFDITRGLASQMNGAAPASL